MAADPDNPQRGCGRPDLNAAAQERHPPAIRGDHWAVPVRDDAGVPAVAVRNDDVPMTALVGQLRRRSTGQRKGYDNDRSWREATHGHP
jgi:hypothetical protein